MNNAIILHGQPSKQEYYDPKMPSMSNAHWIPWLQAQLLKNDIAAATPEVPFAYTPDWDVWVKEVERFDITPDTIIVGHSRGGDFWLKYLSQHPDITVKKVILIAPSLGYLTPNDNYFGRYDIDPELASRAQSVTLFYSDNDHEHMIHSADEIKSIVRDLKYKEFHLGHFTSRSMNSTEFPELLEECLN